jgi:hypothetical protein
MLVAVTTLLEAGLLAWMGLLVLLVGLRLLRRDIPTTGLLTSNVENEDIAPERVAALAIFPAVLVYYVIHALNSDLTVVNNRPVMPDIPENVLALLTGGNGLYLAGKIARQPNPNRGES